MAAAKSCALKATRSAGFQPGGRMMISFIPLALAQADKLSPPVAAQLQLGDSMNWRKYSMISKRSSTLLQTEENSKKKS